MKWVPLEIRPPTIDDNISDLERLKKSLKDNKLEDVIFSHDFLSSMAADLRSGRWSVHFGYIEGPEAVSLIPSAHRNRYGLAIDIGTTTIVAYLVNLEDGSVVDVGSTYNSQIRFGDDVITRSVYATESGGLSELQETVVTDINGSLFRRVRPAFHWRAPTS